MKLVLFADLHLDTPFKWMPADVARGRRQAIRDALESIVRLAEEVSADALCCAGDLYENDMYSPDTAAVIRNCFASLHPMPVIVAPGNHDWYGPESIYATTNWTPNVHIFTDSRLAPFELEQGLTIWGGAHLKPAGTGGFLDEFRVDRSGVNLGLFHGSLRKTINDEEEGKEPHARFDEEDIERAGLDHALVGHFHTPRDGDWHTYPGNPEPLSFGETGDRGAVIVEVNQNGVVDRTRRVVKKSDLFDVSVDVTGADESQDVRNRISEALAPLSGVVRATVRGEVDPSVHIDKSIFDGIGEHLDAFVGRIGVVTHSYDFDEISAEQSVRGEFVNAVRASDMDDEKKRLVLTAGLRALAGRNDLDVI